MTEATISVEWKRNARGYYEYMICIPDAEDKKQLQQAMDISTKLDAVIKAEIERAMKMRDERKKAKPKTPLRMEKKNVKKQKTA